MRIICGWYLNGTGQKRYEIGELCRQWIIDRGIVLGPVSKEELLCNICPKKLKK